MRLRLTLLIGILCILAGTAWWLRGHTADTHDQMLTVLSEVKQRTPIDNAYLGDADLRQLNSQLETADSPTEQMQIRWNRAPVLLRLGQFEEALDDLRFVLQNFRDAQSNMPADLVTDFETDLHYRLAVVNLRIGETANCVHCQTGESCILPIAAGGVHQHPAGSEQAIENLSVVLRNRPDHLAARWLLNLAYMTLGKYPDDVPPELLIAPETYESETSFQRLLNVGRPAGLATFGLAGGVIVDDFDGDDLVDVIASDWKTDAQLRLFRNVGDGTFEDQTEQAGLSGLFGGLNLRHADFDNDGDLDVFVLRGGWLSQQNLSPNSLLENDGHGVFRDVTFATGLGDIHHQTQTADWADFDNDGWIDLFIGNETGPCQLFHNSGRGTFVDVAADAGALNNRFTKGVTCGDFNNDRYPDIYISNLGGPNRLYLNNRDGTFTDTAEQAGVTGPIESFPTWCWDYNNDGSLDIFVGGYDLSAQGMLESFVADFVGLNTSAEKDTLYQGNGTGQFHDVSALQRVSRVTLPMGCNFGDINGDGFLDYYLGTGYQQYDALQPNRLLLNQSGEYFDDVSTASGLSHLQKGHGVSFADLDNDGDQDVFIVLGGANPGDGFSNALFRNPGFENHWITVELHGTQSNAAAIGARIRVVIAGAGRQQSIYRWITAGSSFGGNPFRQTIGLGAAQQIRALEVYWPASDTTQTFADVAVDQFVEITEGDDQLRSRELPTFELPSES